MEIHREREITQSEKERGLFQRETALYRGRQGEMDGDRESERYMDGQRERIMTQREKERGLFQSVKWWKTVEMLLNMC